LTDVEIEWVKPELNDGDKGIVAVDLIYNDKLVHVE